MCGIASILFYPEKRSPQIWEEIKENFTANLLFNEKRGKSATGIAIIRQDKTIQIYKQAIPAHEFVKTDTYQKLLNSLDEQTTILLGHTRHPTKGTTENNENNHPIIVDSICGIHNGHISNDDAIFQEFNFPRKAEVDSEVIFRLVAKSANYGHNNKQVFLQSLENHLQKLEGKFTFLSVNIDHPEHLIVVKYNNPLSLHFEQKWNCLLFSSSYLFLRKIFGVAVIKESLNNQHLYFFDALKLLEKCHLPKNIISLNLMGNQ